MLFLVNIDVTTPPDMPQAQKDDFRARETARAMELIAQKKLRRIWRVVGQVANYSLWEADTLEELHANLNSLPMYPFFKVKVTPLIEHPAVGAWTKEHGPMPPI